MSRRVSVAGAVALAVAVVGVVANPFGLNGDEKREVAAAEAAIERNVPEGERQEVRRAVDRLIAVFRAHPDSDYEGRPMRDVLTDASHDLRRYWHHDSNRLLWERDRGSGPTDVGGP